MNILEKVKEIERQEQSLKKLIEEIKNVIFKTFINVSFEVKLLNKLFNIDFKKDAFYPILDVPEDFVKEKERCYKISSSKANNIIYEYELNKDGTKIRIVENTQLSDIVSKSSRNSQNYISFKNWYIPVRKISYVVTINGKVFEFYRSVNYSEILKSILQLSNIKNPSKVITFNKKEQINPNIAVINDEYIDMIYFNVKKRYINFLKKCGCKNIKDLKQLILLKNEDIYLSHNRYIKIDIFKFTINVNATYNSSMFSANLYFENCTKYLICVKLYEGANVVKDVIFQFIQHENGNNLNKYISIEDVIKLF